MTSLIYMVQIPRGTTRAILPEIKYREVHLPKKSGRTIDTLRSLRLLRAKKGDVVIVDNCGRGTCIILMMRMIQRHRVVIRVRGDTLSHVTQYGGWAASVKAAAVRAMLRSCDLIVFNSNYIRNLPQYDNVRESSAMIHNPLMITDLSEGSNTIDEEASKKHSFSLISATNFGVRAKVAPLARALRQWIDLEFLDNNRVHWSILGKGPHLKEFIEEFSGRDISKYVKIYGYRRDIHEFYKSHHLFVHLSGLDSLPNVALEAAFHGLPIITIPESGGTLEAMRDGETGRVVSDGDGFRRAILEYRDDPDLRRTHGRNGRSFVLENFTIERQRAKMAALLAERFGIGGE